MLRDRRAVFDALVAVAIGTLTLLVFLPALRGDWLQFDDDRNFLQNAGYRGLGPSQLRWMLTGAIMGHWTPVTWLSHGVDYVMWGMNPAGYHFGNVVLHAANAALVFALASHLLSLGLSRIEPGARRAGAAAVALVFGLHPLRAESVAWITERRDVLSALFGLLAVLAYLRFAEGGARRRRWYALSLALFGVGLLAKSMLVSLPVVLLVLDAYPLGRLDLRAWRAPTTRRVLLEKLPYVALSAASVAITSAVMAHTVRVTSLALYGPAARVAMAAYSLVFYPVKLLAPLDLRPMYELPMRVSLVEPRFLLPLLVVMAVTVALWLGRRRWPAGLAAWLAYAALLAPVAGLAHAGPQLVADRFSYLPSVALVLPLGAGVALAMAARTVAARALVAAVGVWIVSMALLTQSQIQIWHDTDTLFVYAIEVDPDCGWCYAQYGGVLGNRGDFAGAIPLFERAVLLRPHRAGYQAQAGLALLRAGRAAEAVPYLERAVAIQPENAGALTDLGVALLETNRAADAVPFLQRAVAVAPAAEAPRAALARAQRQLAGKAPGRR